MTKRREPCKSLNTICYRDALALIVSEIERQDYDPRTVPLSTVLACTHNFMIADERLHAAKRIGNKLKRRSR